MTQIHAAEYSHSQETVFSKTVFPDLSDDDLVIELPDGGYLYGKCEVYDISDQTSPIIIYDSPMDSNAIPVKKVRNRIKYHQTAFPTQTYEANPQEQIPYMFWTMAMNTILILLAEMVGGSVANSSKQNPALVEII